MIPASNELSQFSWLASGAWLNRVIVQIGHQTVAFYKKSANRELYIRFSCVILGKIETGIAEKCRIQAFLGIYYLE